MRIEAHPKVVAMRSLLILIAVLATAFPGYAQMTPDPFAWLEEMDSPRALDWAKAENAASLPKLQGDPRYEQLRGDALAALTAADRIPAPDLRGEEIDNFWQDQTHVRGIWRRTSLGSYRSDEPIWRTIMDIDALAKAEGKNWVFKGYDCLQPDERLCLVSLSDGGKDAVSIREFDAEDGKWIDGGFNLPEGKHRIEWIDKDTLVIATEWEKGQVTTSGYPFVMKLLKRGQPLSVATEVFRGTATDGGYGVQPYVARDPDGKVQGIFAVRPLDTFAAETYYLVSDSLPVKLSLPGRHYIRGFVSGQLIVSLQEDWGSAGYKAGDLISIDVAKLRATEVVVSSGRKSEVPPIKPAAELVIRPGERESIEQVTTTRNRLVVALYENVRGAAYAYERADGKWQRKGLELPALSSVSLGSSAKDSDLIFVSTSNFLDPARLWLANAATGEAQTVKTSPPRFDAAGLIVQQFEATSKDGTKVPYFLVRRGDLRFNSANPTILYGYGGFEVSMTPAYSPLLGKLWLERGGVYVLANIRGGGEFGPKWHTAALRENRQRAYDDFFAVAEDLIRRRVTSPRHLGAMGGSNGGLLMGVALTQRPELFNALSIQVPLFDMIGYTHIGAGHSWVGEYGDPRVAGDRAFIEKYSPYQNLKAGMKYPEVFLSTSTKDDRVHPAHARKAAARLKELGYPYVYYENIDGGHAGAANLNERATQAALDYTYMSQKLMD